MTTRMDRSQVIQKCIDKLDRKATYLEIGVRTGDAFFAVKAQNKIAIDPAFAFSRWKQFRYLFKNPANFRNQFFETTSDQFFEQHSSVISKTGIDVAFVDGLHTHEQSFKDALNCLRHLNDDGVILLHDCNPESEMAAMPLAEGDAIMPAHDGVWNGDVWKTIALLRSTRNDLNIFVLDCDFGIGVITKRRPESMLHHSPQNIAALTYFDLEKDRNNILNLKPASYLEHFLTSLN